MLMKFQHTHRSIVRSIRQVALVKDWLALRGSFTLPLIRDYEPNARAGDVDDMLLSQIVHEKGRMRMLCKRAGHRAETAHGGPLHGRYLDECMEPTMLTAIRPLWDACVQNLLPIYSIAPSSDCNGCPVTLEKLYLPFSRDGRTPDYLLVSLHAVSTEGRFVLEGVLKQNADRAPMHWAVIIDPAMSLQPAARRDTASTSDDFVFV